jgi:hypothetical protein
MNISQLAANGNALDLAIADVKGQVTVKRLRARGPRKGETLSKAQGGGHAVGAVRDSDSNTANISAGTNGARMTLTEQRGYGANMVYNLEKVVVTYDALKREEKRIEAKRRAAEKRAEREAEAFAALDNLLDDIQG